MGNTVVSTLSDESRYFMYKWQPYNSMTIVRLSQRYIDTHLAKGMESGTPIYKYARFKQRVPRQGYNATYIFLLYDEDAVADRHLREKYASSFILNQSELEEAIEEIIYPVEYHITEHVPDTSGLGVAILLYIVGIALSFVFRQWYFAVGIVTYIFIKYLKGVFKG